MAVEGSGTTAAIFQPYPSPGMPLVVRLRGETSVRDLHDPGFRIKDFSAKLSFSAKFAGLSGVAGRRLREGGSRWRASSRWEEPR